MCAFYTLNIYLHPTTDLSFRCYASKLSGCSLTVFLSIAGYWTHDDQNILYKSDSGSTQASSYSWKTDKDAWQNSGKEMGYADLAYTYADFGTGNKGYLMALSKAEPVVCRSVRIKTDSETERGHCVG